MLDYGDTAVRVIIDPIDGSLNAKRDIAHHALSLAVAERCNLGCTYCYAQQGDFGGSAKAMSKTDAALPVSQPSAVR